MSKRVREFWIYQERAAPDLWALHVTVEYDTRRITPRVFDVCMYADFIPGDAKSDSTISDRCYRTPDEFADDVKHLCYKYGQIFNNDDRRQTVKAFINILVCS